MQFTDDELKQLKEAAKMRGGIVSFEDVRPLIRRLEACEATIPFLLAVCQDDRESIEYSAGVVDEAEQAIDAWRKAAGKSPVVRTK